MKKFAFAALLAASVAAPAFAQNNAPFTGFRAEGIVGYDNANVQGGEDDGVVYGGGIGYDFQFGGAVAGIEAEISDSTVDDCADDFLAAGDRICAQIGRDIYVGGRIGAVVNPRTLVYAKAGYVNGRQQVDYDDGTAGGLNDFEVSDDLDGVRVGGGLEYAIGPNSFIKAEYRYSNYEQDVEKHQGVVGFGFRF